MLGELRSYVLSKKTSYECETGASKRNQVTPDYITHVYSNLVVKYIYDTLEGCWHMCMVLLNLALGEDSVHLYINPKRDFKYQSFQS